MIQSGFGCVTGNAIVWNLNKFNALPKNLQDVIVQAGKDAFKNNAVLTDAWYAGALQARATATGNKPYLNFSAADLTKWAGLLGEPVVDWIKAYPPGVTGGDIVVQHYIAALKGRRIRIPQGMEDDTVIRKSRRTLKLKE